MDVGVLDNSFIDSQFNYYRAERTEHGVMDKNPTQLGVKRSIDFLERSVEECPSNPLAVFVIGRAYRMNGNKEAARTQFRRAKRLYAEYGWVPASVRSSKV